MTDTKALQLAARFALLPNTLGFCGKDSAPAKFEACITQGICTEVAEELKHFNVLWPYLKAIGEITGQGALSYPVVASYWLGSALLETATPSHYKILLKYFAAQGIPDETLEEMRQHSPTRFIPFHLWQVLRSSSMGGSTDVGSINNCMVRWGNVVSITDNIAVVDLWSLEKLQGIFVLTKQETELQFARELVPDMKVGSSIATHWGWVSIVLKEKEEKSLFHWTKAVINAQ